MSKYSTVIWDLDGTLLNTLEDLMNAVNFAMSSLGYPQRTLDEIRRFVGNGVKKLMELSIPRGLENEDYDKAYELFASYYSEHNQDNTRPYAGVKEVIDTLAAAGVKQAIVSNKIDYAVQLLNDKFFGVDFAIGTQDGLRRKPDPDMVLKAITELGSGIEETVYIGDSEVDIATAKNTGVDCISVLWGFRSIDELAPYSPPLTVNLPEEIVSEVLG